MRLRGSVLVALLLLTAAAAVARPVVFSSPRAGESIRAGGEVEVRWTGVPSGAEEMELLLSLDGGRRIALRLTSEIPASGHSFFWTVPNLASSNASLVLRVGAAGQEAIVGASAPFTILPDSSLGFETAALRSGELWLASGSIEPAPLAPVGVSAGEGWNGFDPGENPVSVSFSPLLPSPSRTHRPLVNRAAAHAPRPLADHAGLPAAPLPLRI